jgi:endoglycosylceramidase
MPALQHAFDHLWANSPGPGGVGLGDRYAAAWGHVAAKFASSPWVIGYDLINEPWPGTAFAPCVAPAGCPDFDAKLGAFHKRALSAIRKSDRRHLVWYEPNVLFNFGSRTRLPDLGDARLGFSFHDYCSSPPCAKQERTVLANAAARSSSTGDALLLTEWGSTDSATTLTRVADEADAQLMPWTEWAYCGCEDPTGSIPPATEGLVLDPSKPPTGANVKAEKLAILARPHPDAVAGTPLSLASSGYRFAWSTARAGGHGRFPAGSLTTYFVPGLRSGYTVSVRGGRVVSKANAKLLQVESLPGAKRVSFRISGRTHGR